MDIGPGDWVECVQLSPTATGHTGFLRVGSIYCVLSVGHQCLGSDGVIRPAFRIVGQPRGELVSFRADCFRPIYRPKADLIEQLSRPIVRQPEKVGA